MLRSSFQKSFLFLTLISIFTLISCEQSNNPAPAELMVDVLQPITVNWDQTNSIVCFGTSLTYGFEGFSFFDLIDPVLKIGSTNPYNIPNPNETNKIAKSDAGYPGYLDSLLNIKVFNEGYIGAKASFAYSVLADSVLSKNPALVLLEFPANDFLSGNDIPTVKAQMKTIIDDILSHGSKIVLISFVDESIVNNPPLDHILYDKRELAMEYFNMLKDLSVEYNLLFIKDCFKGVFGVAELMGDQFHPNREGYIKMAKNIKQSLKRTFELNGM